MRGGGLWDYTVCVQQLWDNTPKRSMSVKDVKRTKRKIFLNYFKIQLEVTNTKEGMNACFLFCFIKNIPNEKGIEISGQFRIIVTLQLKSYYFSLCRTWASINMGWQVQTQDWQWVRTQGYNGECSQQSGSWNIKPSCRDKAGGIAALFLIKHIIWFIFLASDCFLVLFVICMKYPELSLAFTEVNRLIFLMTFTCCLYTGLLGPKGIWG